MSSDPIDIETLDMFTDKALASPPVPPALPILPPGDDGLVPLHIFAERAYLAYAMSVVTGRALPAVEDGQKPVQRRILYAMRELGNRSDNPHKKSARIVGDVIGKFHPHGDSSVYEAAVRMAQNFTLRYPLIDGQGNFGSRDGDGAAAMRYTEIRLTPFAETILLAEIDRDTVNFRDNYDGTLREPTLLPARLPVMLLNGSSGIAVGMANEIPPHNLNEVAALAALIVRDPGVSDAEILEQMPGPDFPGGAQIISSSEDIRQVYANGRGSLRVRARWTVEPLARGQWQIAIIELPPGTSAAKVLSEIDEITDPKPKTGKKGLSTDQQNLKAAALGLIDTVRDDSDQAHPVRLLIEPKSRNQTPEELMAFFLANTSLECNTPVNMTVLGRDRKPAQKGLVTILREWAAFRLDAVQRRLAFRLGEVERRIHILDGRLIVFLHIDAVIRVIREADEPKADLMRTFNLSAIQAEDILEIRLRQLARLEGIKIEKERKELAKEEKSLNRLLASDKVRRTLVAEEIEADASRFGDARRTLVEAAEKVTASKVERVVDEAITVLLSKNGFIRTRVGHGIDTRTLTWKDGDAPFAILETRTVFPIVVLDQEGRAYTLRASELPGGKGDGAPLSSLIDLAGQHVSAFLSAPPETRVLLATHQGYGFVCRLQDMISRQKAGKTFMNLESSTLLPPLFIQDEDEEVSAQASDGRLLIMPLAEIKVLSGGRGVQLIALDDRERLVSVQMVRESITVTALNARNQKRQANFNSAELEPYRNKRARRGKIAKR